MGATQEMIKQNVFDWLDALIIGAKAMNTTIQCGADGWRSEASVYNGDCVVDGITTVHIHNIDRVAKAVEFDLQHQDFTPANEYYVYFTGEDFFIYNGVKFSDMINGHISDEEREERRKVRNAWEQSSSSGTSENESVADEQRSV